MIVHDFSIETQIEIKKIINIEMKDAECKCLTGRINRLVNCLSGFSSLVDIKINDSEQISNLLIMLRTKYVDTDELKKVFCIEMIERGYGQDVIDEWFEFVE
jgi:hypothetical protein